MGAAQAMSKSGGGITMNQGTHTQLTDGQWVYIKGGTFIPLSDYPDGVPDGVTPVYRVDYTTYDSKESYEQIKAQEEINGAVNKARFDLAPDTYPACASDPPYGPERQCGYENCPLHNILWLEFEGCTHEQAVGLTAVYSFSDGWGYGNVVDALGGMDQFNEINEQGPDIPKMQAWYAAHKPLVQYILETTDRDLLPYWWQAQIPTYHIPKIVEWSMLVHLDENQQWTPFQLDGYPLIFTDDSSPDVSNADPDYTGPDYWLTRHWAHITFDIG
jgi:hypothetical protein